MEHFCTKLHVYMAATCISGRIDSYLERGSCRHMIVSEEVYYARKNNQIVAIFRDSYVLSCTINRLNSSGA